MPVTVSGCNPDAEVGVIAEQQWRSIQERRAAGMSVSGIARELDLDRKQCARRSSGRHGSRTDVRRPARRCWMNIATGWLSVRRNCITRPGSCTRNSRVSAASWDATRR
jgi:hypothetical protein